jgi:hypothetical protein
MITDSCRCGAAVTIRHNHYSDEQVTHCRWLESHAGCRSYSAAQPDGTRGESVSDYRKRMMRTAADGLDVKKPETSATALDASGNQMQFMRSDRIEDPQPAAQTGGATLPTFSRCLT